jgi:fructose-bisphosphate aldolase, class II
MSLINLKDLLADARKKKYAVGAFAITNLDFIDAILDVTLEKKSPVILLLAEAHFKYLRLEKVAPLLIEAAENINIPVCICLDHGQNFESVMRAIRAGFTSVMFDGSKHSLEENIKLTREITAIAHSVDVSVEAELGYIGGESVGEVMKKSSIEDKSLFTSVEDALKFQNSTDVDALAVAIGNLHGLYSGEPELDFIRLDELNNALDIPLVLHGGSGLTDNDYKKAISLGICKVNYYTDMSVAAVNAARDCLKSNPDFGSYPDLVKESMAIVKDLLRERFDVFGCTGQCSGQNTLCLSNFHEEEEILNENNYKKLVNNIAEEVIRKIKE